MITSDKMSQSTAHGPPYDRQTPPDGRPPAGPAAALRRLRHPPAGPGPAGARVALVPGPLRQRLLLLGLALLGPDQPPRAAADGAAGSDAGPDQPGRHRRRHPCPAAGRP